MIARRTKFIKESGPYKVYSYSDGKLCVIPGWPTWPEYNDIDGGGPGVMSRMRLASEIEEFLNVGTKEFAEGSRE